MSDSARQPFTWSTVWQWLQKSGAVVTVAAIAIFGFWGGHFLLPGQEHSEGDVHVVEVETEETTATVVLSQEKFDAAQLVVAPVITSPFQAHKAIPGTIAFDATQKVDLRATVTSVVKETLVKPNQFVQQGDPLLVLTAPGIGTARNDISQCESSVDLLNKEHAWTVETHNNIEALLALLDRSPSTAQIKAQFDNKKLGIHRNEILTSYADVQLARQLAARTERLVSQGAISGKKAQERTNAVDVAAAKYDSIREEMTFQMTQQLAQSQAQLDAAQKRLAIRKEQLSAMLGPNARTKTGINNAMLNAPDTTENAVTLANSAGDNGAKGTNGVSEFIYNAPQAGQVVSLPAVRSARFEPGEVMAQIANTSEVWVEAQVSQRDWHSLILKDDQRLSVRIPALPAMNFDATVRHIGASVSKETMAIPIVAQLLNNDKKFRPGMSVWVDIPISETRSAIVVPTGAVQRKANETFVFVKTGTRTFEKRDVVLGEETEHEIEIASGLKDSDMVVVEGSFFLKSEMLLAEEE